MKGLLFLLLGVTLLILGEFILHRMKKCKEEVLGKIVDIQGYRGNIKWSLFTTCNLIIEYTYDGTILKSRTLNAITVLSSTLEKTLEKKGINIGQECKIMINHDKPEDICTEYKRNPALVIGGIFLIIIGLLMIMFGY